MNMQSCLEKRGMDERHTEIVRSDYNIEDQYSASHKDAISGEGSIGKGTNHGGHGDWLPDCNKPTTTINYDNFDTENGGNLCDIKNRKKALVKSLYNKENPYSANSVSSEANITDGQVIINYNKEKTNLKC